MANTRSLLWQPSLLDACAETPGFDAQFTSVRRVELDDSAWVEQVPGWVHGADALFAMIVERAPWTQRRVHMYKRMVDEPRLLAWYGTALDDASLPPVIGPMAAALSDRYGRVFDGVGAALYRDGRDSVAWHGDRIPAEIVEPVVALISLGSPRTLRMRRKETTAERPEGSGARNRPIRKETTAERPEGSGAAESTHTEGDDSGATGGERSAESTHTEGDDSGATGGERSAESTHTEGDDSGATGGERSAESTHEEGAQGERNDCPAAGGAVVPVAPRRSVRDGRRVAANLGALGPEGRGCRSPTQPPVPPFALSLRASAPT